MGERFSGGGALLAQGLGFRFQSLGGWGVERKRHYDSPLIAMRRLLHGARIVMMRLARMNRVRSLLGDWTSPSELLPASGRCQRPGADMSARTRFVNARRSIGVMGRSAICVGPAGDCGLWPAQSRLGTRQCLRRYSC